MALCPMRHGPLRDLLASSACPALSPGTVVLILQKGEIRVINQTTCEKLMPQQITARMMCVGYLSGGVDACQVGAAGVGLGGGPGWAGGWVGALRACLSSGRFWGPPVQRGSRWADLPGWCGELG